MGILDVKAVRGFIRMCSDGWLQGWHERNGGNLTYRLRPEEVAECTPFFGVPGEWVSMGVADRTLAGEYFITTGIRHRLRPHAHNRKGCQICVLALSAGQGQIRQTISDENLRAIAQSFGVQLNETFLDI